MDKTKNRETLERLEDAEDLKELEEMRKGPLKFTSLEEFLEECKKDVLSTSGEKS